MVTLYASLSCWPRHSVPKGVCTFPQSPELHCQTSGRKQLVLTTERMKTPIHHWHIPPFPAASSSNSRVGSSHICFYSVSFWTIPLESMKAENSSRVRSTSKCALMLWSVWGCVRQMNNFYSLSLQVLCTKDHLKKWSCRHPQDVRIRPGSCPLSPSHTPSFLSMLKSVMVKQTKTIKNVFGNYNKA